MKLRGIIDMSYIEVVKNEAWLEKYANKEGIVEIALRGKGKRFKRFQKIALNNTSERDQREILNKVIEQLKKNNQVAEKGVDLIGEVSKLQVLNLILGAANLCATCAGFKIMYNKLDKISIQMNRQLMDIKQDLAINTTHEFKKLMSEHRDMLDSRKTKKYYDEAKMRKLVDDEYNVLELLVEKFIKEDLQDQEAFVFAIYSLASMLAVSIRYFDELYYFENKERIGNGDVWHTSHDNWISVYKKLTDHKFVEKLQDHAIFNRKLSTHEADVFYISLCDQIRDLEEDIKDNQMLITELDNKELFMEVSENIDRDVAEAIQRAVADTNGALENAEVNKIIKQSMEQMALAV